MPFDVSDLFPITNENNSQPKIFANWMKNEPINNISSSAFKNSKLASTPYSKWSIFNINSWGFVAANTENNLNLGLNTQDILSTTTTAAGFGYDPNEKQTSYFANINYEGLYPIFDLNFANSGRQTIIPKGSFKDQKNDLIDNWREQSIDFGVKLPFTFIDNKYSQKLIFNTIFSNIIGLKYDLPGRYQTQVANRSIQSLVNSISYSRAIKMAKRDVGSRWSQSLYVYNRNTPFGKNLEGSLFALQGSLNFPGFTKHDYIKLRANYLHNGSNYVLNGNDNTYFFNSPILFPRGYSYEIFKHMYTTSMEYKTPIADPDFAIGRLLYFQRVKAGVFYDYGQGQYKDENGNNRVINYNSMGLDVSTIFNIIR